MKIIVVADGRSPITSGWVKDLLESGHEVILVSSFPCKPIVGVSASEVLPIAFSRFAGSQAGHIGTNDNSESSHTSMTRKVLKQYKPFFQNLRYFLGPLTLLWYRPVFLHLLKKYQPQIIHALRIPFEGMLAVAACGLYPVVISIWGNDLTLHASKNILMRHLTRKVLQRCAGLIADVNRDLTLASAWGFDLIRKPSMVALTSGGIDMQLLLETNDFEEQFSSLGDCPIIINPRGIRPGYVRNDTFFAAIPIFLKQWQKPVAFVCPSMLGQPEAESWVAQYGIENQVILLPFLEQKELWSLFRKSTIMVSVTEHDGTPNSLLESMTFGVFPIVGDLESLREWITQGKNGILVDPARPQELATAMLKVMNGEVLRQSAAKLNYSLVADRADRQVIRKLREDLYSQILNQPAE